MNEAAGAMQYLGIAESRYVFFRYPDGRIHLYIRQVTQRLQQLILAIHPSTIYVPAFEGGHIDHDIAHVATVLALRDTRWVCRLMEFPIYNAIELLPLFPFKFRVLPASRYTTCRDLSTEEYDDVLKYWDIYGANSFRSMRTL